MIKSSPQVALTKNIIVFLHTLFELNEWYAFQGLYIFDHCIFYLLSWTNEL